METVAKRFDAGKKKGKGSRKHSIRVQIFATRSGLFFHPRMNIEQQNKNDVVARTMQHSAFWVSEMSFLYKAGLRTHAWSCVVLLTNSMHFIFYSKLFFLVLFYFRKGEKIREKEAPRPSLHYVCFGSSSLSLWLIAVSLTCKRDPV